MLGFRGEEGCLDDCRCGNGYHKTGIVPDYQGFAADAFGLAVRRPGGQYLPDSDIYPGADADIRAEDYLCVPFDDSVRKLDDDGYSGIHDGAVDEFRLICRRLRGMADD